MVPAKTMKMMSLGDQLARLVGNDDSRKKLHFRANRQTVPGEMSDYFDGAEYKRLQALHFFQSPDDIAIALFLDGFVNQKKSKQEMTLVHVMILNYDPSIRYNCYLKLLFLLASIQSLNIYTYIDILTNI